VNLAVASVCFLLPWAVALVQVLRRHHLDSGAVGIVVSVSLGLPALWLTVAGYREARSSAQVSNLTMAHVADQLAVAVRTQWEAEASMRRLNDPYPLPVSWDPADQSLTDSWDSLVRLARSGAGWPAPPSQETWADDPDGLAGEGGELVEVLAKVPTGRLVVLGEPGAGKTMLMVRLVLDMLARRAVGGPVPFLASVASWNPAAQDLRGWLDAQLLIDHPALAKPPPAGRTEPTQAAALLASELILPVLDGLDEIPEQVRGSAISQVNDALRPGEQMVITCRTQQYWEAIRPQGGLEVTLRAAAGVQLRLLDAEAVRGYLCDDAAGPAMRARWDPVLAALATGTPVAQALTTPLMVGLARSIYNLRTDEYTGTLPDPAELCALADEAAIKSHLLDAFIPAAYRTNAAGGWAAQQAETWLVFLARHLEYRIRSPDLAWWELRQATPYALEDVAAIKRIRPSRGLRFAPKGLVFGILFGLVGGLVIGFSGWLHGSGLVAGLVGGLLFAMFGLGLDGFGLSPVFTDLEAAASPQAVLARERRVVLVLGLGSALAVLLAVLLAALLVVVLGFRHRFFGTGQLAAGVISGLLIAVMVGVLYSWGSSVWPPYILARRWLASERRLPWSLMGFLADAHQRGVLRQAGAVYQFRHIELQHRLANRGTDKQ
jgi:hypothetical protein